MGRFGRMSRLAMIPRRTIPVSGCLFPSPQVYVYDESNTPVEIRIDYENRQGLSIYGPRRNLHDYPQGRTLNALFAEEYDIGHSDFKGI